MADPSARMLELLSALQDGRAWTGPALADRLGASPRTVRRDIGRLRSLGYPVRARPGPGGAYQLVAGTAVPPLLSDAEAVTIVVGLRSIGATAGNDVGGDDAAASGALRKLEQVLPTRLRRTVSIVAAATEAVATRAGPDPALFGLLAEAIARGRRLRFTYRSRDRRSTVRHADPFRQVRLGGHWYLLAFDVDRADWRTFRLDRCTDVEPTGEHVTPRALPGGSGAAAVDAAVRGARERAVLELDAPAADLAGLLDVDADLEALPDGRCRVHASVDSWSWLALIVAGLDVEFRVISPPEFADHVRALAVRLHRATG